MEAEAAVCSDDPNPAQHALTPPSTSLEVVEQQRESLVGETDVADVETNQTGEKGEEEFASPRGDSDDAQASEAPVQGAALPEKQEKAVSKIATDGPGLGSCNADTKDVHGPENPKPTSGQLPNPNPPVSTGRAAAAPTKRRKRAAMPPAIVTRCLPARDSRVAATLQNQFVVECERFGWRVSPSGNANYKTQSKAYAQTSSLDKSRPAKRSSTRQTGATTHSLPREKEELVATFLSKKRNMTTTPNNSPVTAQGGNAARRKQKKAKDGSGKATKHVLTTEKLPNPRAPPPTDSGRPRRQAADRAAAAILAAAAPSHGGFLVLDIPPKGAIPPPEEKRGRRKGSCGSAHSDSLEGAARERTRGEKESNRDTVEGGSSDAERHQQEEIISTDPGSKEDDTREAEERESNKRKKTEAAAATDAEAARPVEEPRMTDEVTADEEKSKPDSTGINGDMDVTVELETR